MFPRRSPVLQDGGGDTYMEWRLLDALFLAVQNFANSNLAKGKATVDAREVCFIQFHAFVLYMGGMSIYISARVSALLILARWTMQRLRIAEWVTGTDSHAFFVYVLINRNKKPFSWGV